MNIFQSPELFDVFGFIAFAYVIFISIWVLRSGRSLPKWIFGLLLLIGLVGVIIDGAIVYTFFLK